MTDVTYHDRYQLTDLLNTDYLCVVELKKFIDLVLFEDYHRSSVSLDNAKNITHLHDPKI